MWQDIVARRNPNRAALRSALARLFGVDEQAVMVVEDMLEVDESAKVVCHVLTTKGDFQVLLSIYNHVDMQPDLRQGASDIAAAIGCGCLADDGTDNPYTMLLVGEGATRRVSLDVEALDDESYVLSNEPAGGGPA